MIDFDIELIVGVPVDAGAEPVAVLKCREIRGVIGRHREELDQFRGHRINQVTGSCGELKRRSVERGISRALIGREIVERNRVGANRAGADAAIAIRVVAEGSRVWIP